MDKKKLSEAVKNLREFSKQRKFKQSIDIIINLKGVNVKKQDNQIDHHIALSHPRTKKLRICALVGSESAESAKVFDKVITQEEFSKYQADPDLISSLTKEFDLFVAQANIMGPIATTFGRTLGPKGLMPNPKAGAVFPPTADMKELSDRLQKTVRLQAKKVPILKASIGNEDMSDEDIEDNVLTVYNRVIHSLPQEEGNVKDVMLKTTMGPAIRVGEKKEEIEARLKLKEKPKKEKKDE